jgi:hypothetical protein
MTTDFRALCAGLLKGLDENRHPEVRYPGDLRILMAEARALLAKPVEPVGEGATLEGVDDLEAAWNAESDKFNSWDELGLDEIVAFAQERILTRYAPPPAPVAVEPWHPTPQTHTEVADGLRRAFRQAIAEGAVDAIPTPEAQP